MKLLSILLFYITHQKINIYLYLNKKISIYLVFLKTKVDQNNIILKYISKVVYKHFTFIIFKNKLENFEKFAELKIQN